MTRPRLSETDPGWIIRRFRKVESDAREQTAAAATTDRQLKERLDDLEARVAALEGG